MNNLINSTNFPIIIGIIGGISSFVWSVYKHTDTKRSEQKIKEFEHFHRLIKELVQPENEKLFLDRQTAIIYELQRFKRYYPYTLRTLKGLEKKWTNTPDQYPRLLEELCLAIKFLEKKVKSQNNYCAQHRV
jgi:hypothetical protein